MLQYEEIVKFSNIVIDPGILEIFKGHGVRVLVKTTNGVFIHDERVSDEQFQFEP